MVVTSVIDAETFREYAIYNALRWQKQWRRPAVFALSFLVFAALAFSRVGKVEGAALLGGVLLAVGLGLPAVYFGAFLHSVRRQARQLDPREIAYTVTLSDAGVAVRKGKQNASYTWETLCAACRLKRCVCLYVDAQHALLLTGGDGARIWAYITRRIAAEKLKQ